MNQDLERYISAKRRAGVTDDDIRRELLDSGWDEELITSALNQANTSTHILQTDERDGTTRISSQVDQSVNNQNPSVSSENRHAIKKRRPIALVLSGLIVAGILFGGYVYLQPERVLNTAVRNVFLADQLEYTATITATIPAYDYSSITPVATTQAESISVPQVLGIQDVATEDSPTIDGLPPETAGQDTILQVTATGTFDSSSEEEKSSVSITYSGSGTDFDTSGQIDAISIGDVIYINIISLPDLGLLDVSNYTNRWIEFDIPVIAAEYGFKKEYEEYKKTRQLTPQQEQQIIDLVKKTSFLTLVSSGSLSISGISPIQTHSVTLDPDGFQEFVTEFEQITNVETDTVIDDRTVETQLNQWEEYDFDLSIDLLRSLPTNLTVRRKSQQASDGSFTAELELDSIGQAVSISPPATSTPALELLKELEQEWGGSLGQPSSSTDLTNDEIRALIGDDFADEEIKEFRAQFEEDLEALESVEQLD